MKSSLTEKWIVCRVCLKQPKESMQSIFDQNMNKDLTQMILECGGVPIKKYDHYPDKICGKCLKYLRVAYKFRITCQRSHKHLSRFIAPVDEEQDQDQVEDDPMPDLSVEIDEEAEEIALKLEPEDAMGIKTEFAENGDEEEVVELFIPMDEDEEEAAFAEFDAIDRSVSSVSGEAEYLDDIGDDFSTSEEEYSPKKKDPPTKKVNKTKAPKVLKGTNQTKRIAAKVVALSIKKEKPEKKEPKPKREKQTMPKREKETKPKREKQTSYICDVCGNIYPSQGRLTEHIKLHKGIKPHECEICGHAFAQTQQLARHMNTHTGNRPFKCNYCPAAFADLSTRNKHHRIHTNERPYICDVCGKSFTYTNTLKFHKMIHTGEKPHVCDVCGKGFQQAYKLRNHKMTHEKKGVKLEKIEVDAMNYQEVNVATAQILEI